MNDNTASLLGLASVMVEKGRLCLRISRSGILLCSVKQVLWTMKTDSRLVSMGMLVAMVMVTGCSKQSSYVPVSGVVTFNNQPAVNVRVTFTPQVAYSDRSPFSSAATTDQEGRYELVTLSRAESQQGAFVGRHKVTFSRANRIGVETLPAPYNQNSTHEIEVSEAGNTSADFSFQDEALIPEDLSPAMVAPAGR